jgi:hypothetical protein
MEPDVRKFLAAIVQTMSMTVLWMLLNTVFGIKMGLLFLDEEITIWHGVYYLCLIASFIWLVIYIRKKWKDVPKFDLEQHNRP